MRYKVWGGVSGGAQKSPDTMRSRFVGASCWLTRTAKRLSSSKRYLRTRRWACQPTCRRPVSSACRVARAGWARSEAAGGQTKAALCLCVCSVHVCVCVCECVEGKESGNRCRERHALEALPLAHLANLQPLPVRVVKEIVKIAWDKTRRRLEEEHLGGEALCGDRGHLGRHLRAACGGRWRARRERGGGGGRQPYAAAR